MSDLWSLSRGNGRYPLLGSANGGYQNSYTPPPPTPTLYKSWLTIYDTEALCSEGLGFRVSVFVLYLHVELRLLLCRRCRGLDPAAQSREGNHDLGWFQIVHNLDMVKGRLVVNNLWWWETTSIPVLNRESNEESVMLNKNSHPRGNTCDLEYIKTHTLGPNLTVYIELWASFDCHYTVLWFIIYKHRFWDKIFLNSYGCSAWNLMTESREFARGDKMYI